MERITIEYILRAKGKSKITMLTCYDYSFAKALDEAGIDIVLVGDSLANVVLGLTETRKVSFSEMLNHTKAVAKAVNRSLIVADMPYVSYQTHPNRCVDFARKFINAGAQAVKVEWCKDCVYVVKKLIKNNIPVMGHIGLTPQTAHLLGGYKVQGRDAASARSLIRQAKILQDLGVFSIVLECVPYQLSRFITKQLKIPTIGIGAGRFCDGQVLVLYDFIGLYKRIKPKFVRAYKNLFSELKLTTTRFIKDVKSGKFPNKNESFSINNAEYKRLWRDFRKTSSKQSLMKYTRR
ncbi:MAG: 3-methyl-2-oxobutanoate hydroxymethyltransferase [Candidatus Omnitrophota bacterium]|nr:3-methyl-2-oxobutanoate hydroxymethyltransferase [Candidatus Omnitrophota bacterium]